MAEPIVRFVAAPTGTEAASGSTVIGGGVRAGVALGEMGGTAAGEAEGVGETGGAGGEGRGDGVWALAAAQSARKVKRSGASLSNLWFGAANGRRQQRLVPDAREKNRYQVALGALDRTHTKFRMAYHIGYAEAAG